MIEDIIGHTIRHAKTNKTDIALDVIGSRILTSKYREEWDFDDCEIEIRISAWVPIDKESDCISAAKIAIAKQL